MEMQSLTLSQLKAQRPDLVKAVVDDVVAVRMDESAKVIAQEKGIPYSEAMVRVISAWEHAETPKRKTPAKVQKAKVVEPLAKKTPRATSDPDLLAKRFMRKNPSVSYDEAMKRVSL